MEKLEKLKDIFSSVETDAQKFYEGGNAAAGTRVRKAMQEIKIIAQEIRTEITEVKNKDK
jgi:hypothetical protein